MFGNEGKSDLAEQNLWIVSRERFDKDENTGRNKKIWLILQDRKMKKVDIVKQKR